ncbi:MAG: hypothetical protein AUK63_1748 [bacterium P3]|nr:MAG: hypothetical protein AUK63_1748 [bacterium P3]KWW38696.1 MAG: hypothetical protein F083_2150 [bacterium F083]
MKIQNTIGNTLLWQQEKTLFLTSKMAPIGCYGTVFAWVDALKQQDTVVCFNTSELEAEVVKAILVNRVPAILVVMNRFRDIYNVQIEQALQENRLLILELLREKTDGTGDTPQLRNRFVIQHVEHIVCGYINPRGSISPLLAGLNNITHLVSNNTTLLAAESKVKTFRWTVAEDKRLLRMFYEDMGIHAIHKALDRPYSTVRSRIKALTMNDEVLKGREFEDYVLELFDVPHRSHLTLKEWRGDKSLPDVYPEANSAPDFVFEHYGQRFAVECKWRNHIPRNIETDLIPASRKQFIQRYSASRRLPVLLVFGVGGLPCDPDAVYLIHLPCEITRATLRRSIIQDSADLFDAVETLLHSDK